MWSIYIIVASLAFAPPPLVVFSSSSPLSRVDLCYIPLLHLLLLFIHSIGPIMAPSTLFALVALATTTYVAGQSTTAAPAANPAVPTFPATPLASMSFPYSQIVWLIYRYLTLFPSLLTFTLLSRTKPYLVNMLVGPRLATINATLPPRTSSLCARPLLSMTSLVRSIQSFHDSWTNLLFRLLRLCPKCTQFDHRGH